MALNVTELRKQIVHATVHPEKHDQSSWATSFQETTPESKNANPWAAVDPELPRPSACGSFGCIAGNVAIDSGAELLWYQHSYTNKDGKLFRVWHADSVNELTMVPNEDYHPEYDPYEPEFVEEYKSIHQHAREVLDLTERQAEALFDGGNDLDRLWKLSIEMSAGEITSYDRTLAEYERDEIARAAEAKAKAESTD